MRVYVSHVLFTVALENPVAVITAERLASEGGWRGKSWQRGCHAPCAKPQSTPEFRSRNQCQKPPAGPSRLRVVVFANAATAERACAQTLGIHCQGALVREARGAVTRSSEPVQTIIADIAFLRLHS